MCSSALHNLHYFILLDRRRAMQPCIVASSRFLPVSCRRERLF